MTILLTGGTGRTATAVARRLSEAGIPFLVLPRSSSSSTPFESCRFDWDDETTFNIPFSKAAAIDAVYIVVPITVVDDQAKPITAFIDFARRKGVKRFVALSMSNAEPGKRIMGAVHAHLKSSGSEYAVLRPTWYMGK